MAQEEVNDEFNDGHSTPEPKPGMFAIVDINRKEFCRYSDERPMFFHDLEYACSMAGMLECEDAWVVELKYNHREYDIWPEHAPDKSQVAPG